jgi:hypothetical protein
MAAAAAVVGDRSGHRRASIGLFHRPCGGGTDGAERLRLGHGSAWLNRRAGRGHCRWRLGQMDRRGHVAMVVGLIGIALGGLAPARARIA